MQKHILPSACPAAARAFYLALAMLLLAEALAIAPAAAAALGEGEGVTIRLLHAPLDFATRSALYVRHEQIKSAFQDLELEETESTGTAGSTLTVKAVATASVATGDNSATIRNLANAQYSVPVSIGSPAQTFYLLVDTGSTDTWVINSNCTNCRARSTKYTSSASSTYAKDGRPFSIQYGSGAVEGVIGKETVSMAGFSAAGQAIGLAHSSSGLGSSISGILGLAFPSIATPAMRPPLFDSIMTAHALAANVFTLTLADTTAESTLRIGGYPSGLTYYDLPLLSQDYWAVAMPRLTVGTAGANLCLRATCKAIVDSGTSLFIGPTAVIQSILSLLAAAAPASATSAASGATRTWDCSGTQNLPTLYISLRGTGTQTHVVALSPQQYVIGYGTRSCVYGFDALDSSSFDFILGDVFMRAAVTVFDRTNARVRISPTGPTQVSSYDCSPGCSPVLSSATGASSSASSSSSSAASSGTPGSSPTTWSAEDSAAAAAASAASASAEDAASFGGLGVVGVAAVGAAASAIIVVVAASVVVARRWSSRRALAASAPRGPRRPPGPRPRLHRPGGAPAPAVIAYPVEQGAALYPSYPSAPAMPYPAAYPAGPGPAHAQAAHPHTPSSVALQVEP
eukprot:tig00000828_g4621.t1